MAPETQHFKGETLVASLQASPPGHGLAEGPAPPLFLSFPLSGEKDDLLASLQGWKLISQFPHAFCFQFEVWKNTALLPLILSSGSAAAAITGAGAVGKPQHPGGPGRNPL